MHILKETAEDVPQTIYVLKYWDETVPQDTSAQDWVAIKMTTVPPSGWMVNSLWTIMKRFLYQSDDSWCAASKYKV